MPLMMGDWIKGTRGMRADVKGVYIGLLIHQYDNGWLPAGLDELTLIEPEVGKVWVSLKDKFEEFEPGKLQNRKLEEVRAFWTKQSSNGKLGGRPKGTGTKSKYVKQEVIDWEEMVAFFGNSCLCCGCKFPDDDRPTKDHIVPRISGGTDDISNLQPLCRQCNSSKHATHSTDYRLKHFDSIPEDLREKWFNRNPKITQTKPKHEAKTKLHYDLDHDIDFELRFKEAFDEIYIEDQRMKWRHIGFDFQFSTFCEKVRGSPEHYRNHDSSGLRLALQSQLRNAKPPSKNNSKQSSSDLAAAFAERVRADAASREIRSG